MIGAPGINRSLPVRVPDDTAKRALSDSIGRAATCTLPFLTVHRRTKGKTRDHKHGFNK
jgi:hypothetical protein